MALPPSCPPIRFEDNQTVKLTLPRSTLHLLECARIKFPELNVTSLDKLAFQQQTLRLKPTHVVRVNHRPGTTLPLYPYLIFFLSLPQGKQTQRDCLMFCTSAQKRVYSAEFGGYGRRAGLPDEDIGGLKDLSFVSQCQPDLSPSARVLALCGITDHKSDAAPGERWVVCIRFLFIPSPFQRSGRLSNLAYIRTSKRSRR